MKLSVSLSEDDVAFLDRFADQRGLRSRSAAVQRAVEMLRASELAPAYESAWAEWSGPDADAWEAAVTDGLPPADR